VSTTNPQSDAPLDAAPAARARARRRSKQRRRLANVAGLLTGLILTGALYSVFAPAQAADDGASESAAEAAGRELYERSCITCHGENLEGVPNRGPSLIGVGEAAVYFQVHTGRMPLARQEADASEKPPVFSDEEIDQLMAYVQANGGGPTLPSGDLRDGDLAEGGELFRLNCASCHNFVGEGGALSSGKSAPSLKDADDLEIYAAMLTGPENKPV
jgi:ubiquinol-cytochrome c reductase cytochrome c subunit